MSRTVGRDVQRTMRSKAGFMTAAALVYLSSAVETEAEPAANDQTTTEQAPAPAPQQTAPEQAPSTQQQGPSGAAPAASEQKVDVPLPTVSVRASRPRAPAAVRAAPARPIAAPPPAAQPVTTDQASTSTNPPLGATPYQVSNPGITRLPVPLLDMPQTVNVVPQAIMQEQAVTTMEDALRNVPGITFSAGEGGQQGDSPIIRGFVARGDMFRDGIRDPGWYTRDLFSTSTGSRSTRARRHSPSAAARPAAPSTTSPKLPTGAQFFEGTVDGDDRQRLPRRWSTPAARATTCPAASPRSGRTSTRRPATMSGPSAGASRRR